MWSIGPSPRGWGHRPSEQRRLPLSRAIPTRVGTSSLVINNRTFGPGHPHAGGDIKDGRVYGTDKAGPSPRGWGHPPLLQFFFQIGRAIPTRVGTSSHVIDWILGVAGHPHAGGDISAVIVCYALFFVDWGSFGGVSERDILLGNPAFGYEVEAAEFDIAAAGFTFGAYAFDDVALAVWVG